MFSVLVVTVLFISCSKDQDNETSPQDIVSKQRLSSIVYDDGEMVNYYYHDNGYIRKISQSDGDFEEFIYDVSNQLTSVVTDNGSSRDFHYQNGILSYTIDTYNFLDSLYIDTTFYRYNDRSLVSKTYVDESVRFQLFFYDDQDRLLVKKYVCNACDILYDSIAYKWHTDGNLSEKKHEYSYSADGGISYSVVIDQENYEYDSYINPYSTINYHPIYLIVDHLSNLSWYYSKNNVVEKRFSTSTGGYTELCNVVESENGLPTRIVSEYYSMDLFYEKIE